MSSIHAPTLWCCRTPREKVEPLCVILFSVGCQIRTEPTARFAHVQRKVVTKILHPARFSVGKKTSQEAKTEERGKRMAEEEDGQAKVMTRGISVAQKEKEDQDLSTIFRFRRSGQEYYREQPPINYEERILYLIYNNWKMLTKYKKILRFEVF